MKESVETQEELSANRSGAQARPLATPKFLSPALGGTVVVFSVVMGGLLVCAQAHAQVIPADRTMDWANTTIGVPGGIPDRAVVHTNLYPGATANTINEALANCPPGQVVYLNAGIYHLISKLWIGNDDVTLRGAGMGSTVLHFDNSLGSGLGMVGIGRGEWPRPSATNAITAGATKGSTAVTVSNAASVAIGQLIRIEQRNEPGLVRTATENGKTDTNNMSFVFLVTSKSESTIAFEPALPFTLTNAPALAVYCFISRGVGLEDLTLDMAGVPGMAGVYMENSHGCWLKNIEVARCSGRQFWLNIVVNSTIAGCYTHDTPGGSNMEGIDLYQDSCWNLVENNLCVQGGFPMIVLGDWMGGCAGNVIAYNYCLNLDTGCDIAGADISVNHGPHNMFNLFEGNVAMGFGSDGYFGSASHNTLFRNWFYASHPTLDQNVNAINLNRWSCHFSLVGNVLGDSSFPAAPEGLLTTDDESFSYLTRLIYKLGYPNMGNNAFDGTFNPPSTSEQAFDLNVKNTLLRHGNYDFATQSVIWDPTISETNLSASLYLRSKPSWWGNLPWPAIGPDLTPMTGRIPAQNRIRNGTLILVR